MCQFEKPFFICSFLQENHIKINETFGIKNPLTFRGSGQLIPLSVYFLRLGARRLRAWRVGVGAGRGGRFPLPLSEGDRGGAGTV